MLGIALGLCQSKDFLRHFKKDKYDLVYSTKNRFDEDMSRVV